MLTLPRQQIDRQVTLPFLWHQTGARKEPYPHLEPVALSLVHKGVGKFVNRPTSTGGRKYDKFFVYVPTEVAKDSQFPFRAGEAVAVAIDPRRRRLVIDRQVSSND